MLLQGGVRISTEPLRSTKYYKYHTLTSFNQTHKDEDVSAERIL